MILTPGEIEFLAAWAREEWEPACCQLPAHRLQLEHGVSGASLIAFIKAWTNAEQKKDSDILAAASNAHPSWPWPDDAKFQSRLADLCRREREPAA
jgi:hypothetical protein